MINNIIKRYASKSHRKGEVEIAGKNQW